MQLIVQGSIGPHSRMQGGAPTTNRVWFCQPINADLVEFGVRPWEQLADGVTRDVSSRLRARSHPFGGARV